MMAEIEEYYCEKCGTLMEFFEKDGDIRDWACPNCGHHRRGA